MKRGNRSRGLLTRVQRTQRQATNAVQAWAGTAVALLSVSFPVLIRRGRYRIRLLIMWPMAALQDSASRPRQPAWAFAADCSYTAVLTATMAITIA